MKSTFWPPTELPRWEFQEPAMLVDPIVPWAGIVLMHGPRTAGKTQLALALAGAVSTGGRFLERYACSRARTAYVEIDMTPQVLQGRIRAAGALLDHVAFFTADGFDIASGALPTLQSFMALRQFDPQFVIVDSLRKTHRLDENESNTPSRVYGRWHELFPNAALMFLHHDKKVPTGPFAGDPDEAFRGSSAWIDDVDTGLHLQRDKKAKRHAAMLTFSKVRTAESQAPIPISLDPTTLLAVPGDETARTALLGWLAAHPGAKKAEAAKWLQLEGYCARAFAYKLAEELELE